MNLRALLLPRKVECVVCATVAAVQDRKVWNMLAISDALEDGFQWHADAE